VNCESSTAIMVSLYYCIGRDNTGSTVLNAHINKPKSYYMSLTSYRSVGSLEMKKLHTQSEIASLLDPVELQWQSCSSSLTS